MFAMEGADSIIAYLPEEQKDAEDTRAQVEKYNGKCYLFPTDISKMENCKKLVDEALEKMGAINILVNNAAYQNMINGIAELSEYVPPLSPFPQSAKRSLLLTPPLQYEDPRANTPSQRSMAQNLQHKHPPLLLPLQILPRPHEIRRHNHKLRLRKRLHRPPRPPRLHLLQRRHRILHPRSPQPTNPLRHPRQCRLPGSRMDTLDPQHHEVICYGSVQRNADGQTGPAERDGDVFCVFGESG